MIGDIKYSMLIENMLPTNMPNSVYAECLLHWKMVYSYISDCKPVTEWKVWYIAATYLSIFDGSYNLTVVFGINCMSNAGWKLVIVQDTSEHYYCFLPALYECKYYSNPY